MDRSYENKKDPEGWCAIKPDLMMTCIIVSQSQLFHHGSFCVNEFLRPSGLALFEIDLAWSCLILAIRALVFLWSVFFRTLNLQRYLR